MTVFETSILFKTNNCHHGRPLGASPGSIAPVAPLNLALTSHSRIG